MDYPDYTPDGDVEFIELLLADDHLRHVLTSKVDLHLLSQISSPLQGYSVYQRSYNVVPPKVYRA